jgi:hypothetical protein
MMRRTFQILVTAALALTIFSGCSTSTMDIDDRIDQPTNLTMPMTGKWVIENCLKSVNEEESAQTGNKPIGETIIFSVDKFAYSDNYYSNVSYKIKRVNVAEYFLHKNTGIPEKFNFVDNEAFVLMVYSDDNFIMEFIGDSDGKVAVLIDDRCYCMKKISDDAPDVQNLPEGTVQHTADEQTGLANRTVQSGLLFGVRIPVATDDGLGDYKYGTYWISAIDCVPSPVLYAEDIYLPRMDGFWKVKVEKRLGAEGTEDNLVATRVTNTESRLIKNDFLNLTDRLETKLRKSIIYIGNDYVCVENTIYDTQGNYTDTKAEKEQATARAEKTLRTLPIDNMASVDGITISDLAGENGRMAMENAISDLLKNSAHNMIVDIDKESQSKNFALYRKTGHWFFKGRIDIDRQGQLPHMDFNLNLIPPSNMVAYDVLQIPWKEVKDKLPHAIDIYTSPNKDMAVVVTDSEMIIYAIENNKLANEPLAKYSLPKGCSIIMAEWATEDYVPSWERSFIKNNETVLVEPIRME